MRQLDLYFRAFKSLRQYTQDDNQSQKLRTPIAHSNVKKESFIAINYECEIDVDWIENIEEGLIYVEKAIREDRQFIRTEGEVVPIEKVKKVSKTSVEHLSRHSNLVTRAPKNKIEHLIPDKLYIVEKLSDFLVYENRFIYMLLSYLKDFIQMRLDNIKDKTTTYQSHVIVDKEINANQRHLLFKMNYDEVYKNDPFLLERYKEIPLVDRIENIYAIAVSLLSTQLMREVSKAPVIKPPVVKTNVLRMNPNFRASLKLYDYIMSYRKPGFSFKEVKKTFQPFPTELADEMAEIIEMNSFISYVEGNGLRKYLQDRYEQEERKLKELEAMKTSHEIKRLKKRMVEMNEDPAEYILKLEKKNIELEKDVLSLNQEREKNIELEQTIKELQINQRSLEDKNDQLSADLSHKLEEIDVLNQKYFDDMTEAEAVHQQEIKAIEEKNRLMLEEVITKHEAFVRELTERYVSEKEALIISYEQKLEDLIKSHAIKLEELIKSYEIKLYDAKVLYETKTQQLIDQHKSEILAFDKKNNELKDHVVDLQLSIEHMTSKHKEIVEAYQTSVNSLEAEIRSLDDEKKYANAQYLALKMQQGLISDEDDFTSRERFKQLELEMSAYKKLFKDQWKKAKTQIRERVKKDIFTDQDNENREQKDIEQ